MNLIEKAEGTERKLALRWILSIAFLVLWAAAAGVAALYFAGREMGYELFFSYLRLPLLLLLNLLPGVLLALLVFALTNRIWPAVLVSGAVVIAGGVAEFFKMQTRSEPLLASDLRYVAEAAKIGSRYDLTPTLPTGTVGGASRAQRRRRRTASRESRHLETAKSRFARLWGLRWA